MTSIRRILLTPRWAGSEESDWYPWLAGQLGDLPVRRVPLPEPSAPKIERCVEAFTEALAEGDPATTLCVGHSVSVQAWLHTLAAWRGAPVAGLIAVAGWWTVDAPWPSILPWQEAEHDLGAIRRACPRIEVLLSDNDPFTADHEATAILFRERLGATVRVVADRKHFNASMEPAVLGAIEGAVEAALRRAEHEG